MVDLQFFDENRALVGNSSVVAPAIGNPQQSEAFPIIGETIALGNEQDLRFVNAVFSATNNQVDFNNAGFSGTITAVPEPDSISVAAIASGLMISRRRRDWTVAKRTGFAS